MPDERYHHAVTAIRTKRAPTERTLRNVGDADRSAPIDVRVGRPADARDCAGGLISQRACNQITAIHELISRTPPGAALACAQLGLWLPGRVALSDCFRWHETCRNWPGPTTFY